MKNIKLITTILLFILFSSTSATQIKDYIATWEYKGLSIEFSNDGSFKTFQNGKTTKGQWTKQEDGSLSLKMENVKNKKFIVQLTDNDKLKFTTVRSSSQKSESFLFEKKIVFTENPQFIKSFNSLVSKGLSIEQTTQKFIHAFQKGDIHSMSPYFSTDILFLGDHKLFYKKDKKDSLAKKTKEELIIAYHNIIKKIGISRWSKYTSKVKPTFESYATSEEYKELLDLGLFKKDDILYDLHFREAVKGKRIGLDEAVIFVFRKIDDRYLIVGHFADY